MSKDGIPSDTEAFHKAFQQTVKAERMERKEGKRRERYTRKQLALFCIRYNEKYAKRTSEPVDTDPKFSHRIKADMKNIRCHERTYLKR